MLLEHPCTGCRFFFGEFECNRCCNYIFIIGKRRPCPFGKGCTVKEPMQIEKVIYKRHSKEKEYRDAFQKVCKWCGSTFSTFRTDKFYCCDHCREAARNQRKNKAKKERE